MLDHSGDRFGIHDAHQIQIAFDLNDCGDTCQERGCSIALLLKEAYSEVMKKDHVDNCLHWDHSEPYKCAVKSIMSVYIEALPKNAVLGESEQNFRMSLPDTLQQSICDFFCWQVCNRGISGSNQGFYTVANHSQKRLERECEWVWRTIESIYQLNKIKVDGSILAKMGDTTESHGSEPTQQLQSPVHSCNGSDKSHEFYDKPSRYERGVKNPNYDEFSTHALVDSITMSVIRLQKCFVSTSYSRCCQGKSFIVEMGNARKKSRSGQELRKKLF